jgi:hypothetical protein
LSLFDFSPFFLHPPLHSVSEEVEQQKLERFPHALATAGCADRSLLNLFPVKKKRKMVISQTCDSEMHPA